MTRHKLWLLVPVLAVVATVVAVPTATRPATQPTTAGQPTTSPEPVTISWQTITGMGLPISSADGPHCVSPWRAACFDQTQAGVEIAAAHLLVRTFAFVGPNTFDPTIEHQVIGPNTTTLHRLTQQAYNEATANPVNADEPLEVENGWLVGFHLNRYSPSVAQVDVLFRQSDPDGETFTSFRVDMTWCSNGWCLVAPAWGDWRSAATVVLQPDETYYRDYDSLAIP